MKKVLTASLFIYSLIPSSVAFAAGVANVDPCQAANPPIGCRPGETTSFGAVIGSALQFIFIIAVLLALGFLVFGGIKWITSGGDKGGVEAARGMIIAAIIGLVIVVLAYFIINNLVLPFLGYGGGFGDLNARFPTLFGGSQATGS